MAVALTFDAEADIDRWKEDWLRDSDDVEEAVAEDNVELDMVDEEATVSAAAAQFFISDRLFFSSPRVLFTSGLCSDVRLLPVRPLKS